MRTAGYRVAIHPSGADFLESRQHCRPAYVITDLFTPHMDSSETLAAVKGDVITEFGNLHARASPWGRVLPTMRRHDNARRCKCGSSAEGDVLEIPGSNRPTEPPRPSTARLLFCAGRSIAGSQALNLIQMRCKILLTVALDPCRGATSRTSLECPSFRAGAFYCPMDWASGAIWSFEKCPASSKSTSALTFAAKRLLGALPILQGVRERTLVQITHAATQLRVPRRTFVYRPQDECTGLYIIVAGEITLEGTTNRGREKVFALLGRADWFGETALILRRRHDAGAKTTETATTLLHVPKSVVLDGPEP